METHANTRLTEVGGPHCRLVRFLVSSYIVPRKIGFHNKTFKSNATVNDKRITLIMLVYITK